MTLTIEGDPDVVKINEPDKGQISFQSKVIVRTDRHNGSVKVPSPDHTRRAGRGVFRRWGGALDRNNKKNKLDKK